MNYESYINRLITFVGHFFSRTIYLLKRIYNKCILNVELLMLFIDLRKQYYKLGKYIVYQVEADSVSDYSHDQKFIDMISEINKINLCIKKFKNKKNFNSISDSADDFVKDNQPL